MLLPILLSLAGLVLLVLLASIAYAVWVAHKMTVRERKSVFDHPSRLGLQWEDVTFPSRGDKVPLSGWYLPAAKDDRCIILVQGNDHHRNSPGIRALQLGGDLVDRGFSTLLFDFRARGESGGRRSSEGDREQWDVFGAIDYVASRGIPVERVLSSPWCRCLETARLAFGSAETSEALSNLFGRYENQERQVQAMRALVARAPVKTNLVLVTHGSTISALTGVSPATGEMVILSQGALAGRLAVQQN